MKMRQTEYNVLNSWIDICPEISNLKKDILETYYYLGEYKDLGQQGKQFS